MTDLRKAAEMALKALEVATTPIPADRQEVLAAKEALRQALAEPDTGTDRGAWSDVPDATKWVDELRGDEEPEQEPVAWVKTLSEPQPHCVTDLKYMSFADAKASVQYIPLYAAPPKREWVGLTDEEIHEMSNDFEEGYVFLYRSFAAAIEAKLKERNT